MTVDTSKWAGAVFEPFQVNVTDEMIRDFAIAVGEGRLDTAPHTFPIRIYMDGSFGLEQMESIGVPVERVLHAAQKFEHLRPIRAGMNITCANRVGDVSQSKSGSMIFVGFEMEFSEGDTMLARMTFSLAVRNTK